MTVRVTASEAGVSGADTVLLEADGRARFLDVGVACASGAR